MCAREDGIRRSKDLRAEIGKFPNSTNERKQMSTKTNFKRIALVAVTSLGIGVLTSVAPASAGSGTTAPTNEYLYLTVENGAGTGSVGSGTVYTDGNNYSGGYVTSSAASVTSGASATATVLSTGGLTFVTASAAAVCLVATGGRVDATLSATSFNAASTVACSNGADFAANVVPNAGVTSMTVQAFQGSGVASTSPTSGSLIGTYVVTVASAATNGVPSATYSIVTQQASIAASGTAAGTNAYDTTTATPNGRVAVVYVALKDAYNVGISTGLQMSVQATNGAPVNIESSESASAIYSAVGSFDTIANDGSMYIVVGQPVANKAGSTTLTISYNGTVVGTKTITFTGDLAKIEAIQYASGTAGSTGTIRYRFFDDAGTRISDANATGGIGTLSLTATGDGNTNTLGTPSVYTTSSLSGYTTFNCSSSTKSTTVALEVKATNQQGVSIKAPKFDANCALAQIATYTASFDKASYQTGDVATLTIKALDLNGKAVASATTLGAGAVISVGGMTSVSAPTTADTSYNGDGVWTYTYTVGVTSGNYVAAVKLPASAVDDTSKTIQVKIVDSSAGVSNADVLKSIVALIASINKQIQALQKLILKR